MRIRLWNSGRSAIEPADYDGEPFIFDFGTNATVVAARPNEPKVVEADPELLTPKVTLSPRGAPNAGQVAIEQPIPMLNPGESITFEVVVLECSKKIKPLFRIADIKKIVETHYNLSRNIRNCIFLTIAICFIFLLATIGLALSGHGVTNQPLDFIAVVVIWAAILIRAFEFKKRRFYAILRRLPGIVCILLSYLIIHFSVIAFLPAFLSLS